MCGLAGAVETARSSSQDELTARGGAMAACVAHRGPDDSGIWTDCHRGVVLAHRRLSIIDLTPGGHQPMVSGSGRYVLVYNGEVYNHAQLRRGLEQSGVRLRSSSDTEVLLELIAQRGLAEALTMVHGMFALALLDRERNTLLLARDRLGEKPLYYGWSGKTFLFASELSALRSHPDFDDEIDRDALTALLRYSFIPAPHSVHRRAAKLLPGCTLEVPLDDVGTQPVPRPYWSAAEVAEQGQANPFTGSVEEATDVLEQRLLDAVGSCMIADVPLGAFLSGGVDSSTVVALMQTQSPTPIRTYTIGFREPGYDESDHARAVAQHLGTEHTELYVTSSEALGVVPQLATMYDEPFADASQIPTALVSRLARGGVTVALSGDGGDELFGGYSRYRVHRRLWSRIAPLPGPTRRAAARALGSVSPDRYDDLVRRLDGILPGRVPRDGLGDKVHKGARMLTMAGPEEVYRRLLSHWEDPAAVVLGAREPPSAMTDLGRWARLADPTDRMMHLDTICYLPDAVLAKVDRAAMASSLETRVPMLDHRVVEFAWRLPQRWRLNGGEGKWLLRRVLDRHVPRALTDRPKMGFGVPVSDWLRGPLRPWAQDLLSPSLIRAGGVLDEAAVTSVWNEHLSGRRDNGLPLWNVLMLQAWLADH